MLVTLLVFLPFLIFGSSLRSSFKNRHFRGCNQHVFANVITTTIVITISDTNIGISTSRVVSLVRTCWKLKPSDRVTVSSSWSDGAYCRPGVDLLVKEITAEAHKEGCVMRKGSIHGFTKLLQWLIDTDRCGKWMKMNEVKKTKKSVPLIPFSFHFRSVQGEDRTTWQRPLRWSACHRALPWIAFVVWRCFC